TPTSHGTFQLYEHGGRNSSASASSYIAQYFNTAAGKSNRECVSVFF
ncbi:jg22567, partial [Pararge aegeria aegeria]